MSSETQQALKDKMANVTLQVQPQGEPFSPKSISQMVVKASALRAAVTASLQKNDPESE